jgi:hypothetical protein
MKVRLDEVANVDDLLADENSKPSIEWGETFCTLEDNKARIYTNNDFKLEKARLHYYRYPVEVEFDGCVNPRNDNAYTADVECEFKNDIAELIIDEAVSILAGDMELFNNYQRTKQTAQDNN